LPSSSDPQLDPSTSTAHTGSTPHSRLFFMMLMLRNGHSSSDVSGSAELTRPAPTLAHNERRAQAHVMHDSNANRLTSVCDPPPRMKMQDQMQEEPRSRGGFVFCRSTHAGSRGARRDATGRREGGASAWLRHTLARRHR
jgi:hypothetical protein